MLLFTPQPAFYTTSPREQYLQQLAGDAARERYLEPDFCYPDNQSFSSYDDIPQARAREYYRRQEAARQAELKRRFLLERYRQQQLEEERRRRERAYLAELERRKYIDAIRRAYAGRYNRDEQDDDDDDRDEEMSESTHRPDSPAPVRIFPSSPKPSKPQPTREQMNKAATTIQSAFRTHLKRRYAVASLSAIRTSFNDLTSSFEFPPQPSFDSTLDSPSYKLSYDSTNAPIHKYEDALMRLLSKLDGIESNGDLVVREERRTLAREIETELGRLDQKEEEAWEKYRADSQRLVEQTDSSPAADSDSVMENVEEKYRADSQRLVDQTDSSPVADSDSVMENVEETAETESSISEAEMDDRSTVVGDDDVTPVDEEESEEKKAELDVDSVMEPDDSQQSSLDNDDNLALTHDKLPESAIQNESPEAQSDSEFVHATSFPEPDHHRTSLTEKDTEDSGFVVIASQPLPSSDGSTVKSEEVASNLS